MLKVNQKKIIMDAKTKFNVGDRVYIMYYNRIAPFKVHSIHIKISDGDISPIVTYVLYYIDEETTREEKEVFATKDEIIDFLYKNLY